MIIDKADMHIVVVKYVAVKKSENIFSGGLQWQIYNLGNTNTNEFICNVV